MHSFGVHVVKFGKGVMGVVFLAEGGNILVEVYRMVGRVRLGLVCLI